MNAAVFLLSAAILAHEICLLRVLSLAYWHHAAALVVSVALLGFGVAGTLLALLPRLKRETTVAVCACLYAVLIPLSVRAAALVDFNILEVGWQPVQWLRLLALEAIFFLPFVVAALGISVALALRSERPGGIYAANLLGSGFGALLAPLLVALGPPSVALRVAAGVAAVAGVRQLRVWAAVALAGSFLVGGFDLPMSPFKSLPATPGKRDQRTFWGVRGRVDAAEVDSLHYAPGLSMLAPTHPETQEALFLDGHLVGARDRGKPDYLDHTVGAFPFLLLEEPDAALLGVGPDLGRFTSFLDARLVVRVDPNPGRLQRVLIEENRQLLTLASGPSTLTSKPRAWLQETSHEWDLIVHHVPDLHAAAEAPLLTVETLRLALSRTTERGGVVLGCGLATPPRAGLKLLLTAEEVTPHVIAVRSADRLCVWLRRRAPTDAEREATIAFCNENGFDPVRPIAWRFAEPHHETDTPLLAPGDDYPYDVRPATDARPYFFKFFRWSRIGDLFDTEQTSFQQWPYVALLVAFLQVTVLGLLLMAGPLVLSRAARAPAAVFLALGLGFMLLEMAFLQRAMVRLGSPVHAAAAVIGGFLVGSGLGSLAGERLGRPLRAAAAGVVVVAPLGFFFFSPSVALAALTCAVVAFPMGIPFPAALARLDARSVPWALAWNGCASVAAAAAAPLVSSTLSIHATGGAALVLYLFLATRKCALIRPVGKAQ